MKKVSLCMGAIFNGIMAILSLLFLKACVSYDYSVLRYICAIFLTAVSLFGFSFSLITLILDYKKPDKSESKIWGSVGILFSSVIAALFAVVLIILAINRYSPIDIVIMIVSAFPLIVGVGGTVFFTKKFIARLKKKSVMERGEDFAERHIQNTWLIVGIFNALILSGSCAMIAFNGIVGLVHKSYISSSLFTKGDLIIQIIIGSALLAFFLVIATLFFRMLLRIIKSTRAQKSKI